MKQLIRHTTFETNSSSTHSVSVSDNVDVYDTIELDDNGNIEIPLEGFGWSFTHYTKAINKLAYLAIYIRDWVEDEYIKEEFKQRLIDVVTEHTGCNEIIFDFTENDDYDGYLDHQSAECSQLDYILESESNIKNFIFNPNSELRTGNDNEDTPDDIDTDE